MKTCVKGHEMQDAHKRCGDCGGEPKAADTLAKCSDCGVEQAGTNAYCTDCGEVMTKADDAIFDELQAFWEEHGDGGEFKVDPTKREATDVLTKAMDEAAEKGEFFDATPLIKANLDAQHVIQDAVMAVGQRQVATERGLALIARGMLRIRDMFKSFDATAAATKNTPGKSRTTTVRTIPRTPAGDGEGDNTVKLSMFKAEDPVAMETGEGALLKAGDSTVVQFWAQRGLTIGALAQVDPDLAGRLVKATEKAAA